ncbi:MAG: YitT family protein [Chitinophagales bacterium]|nr:YitT family protein [Chitinophagaceae bacterium]MCB9064891.1 YitT family protein [Chitinophagales bacterium]
MSKYKASYAIQDTIYIILGIIFSAFAMKSFLVPNHFMDGGVTGISLFGHEVFHWNLGLLLILTNIPFIIMGAFQISKGFAVKTALAVIGLALAMQFIEFPTITSDNLLVSMFGGFFLGLGIGLAMRGGCAIDGIEVLALYTLKKTSFTITEVILAMNVVIFLSAGFYFGLETALYAMLTYYVAMRTIDYVIEGLEAYTGVTIISGMSEEVKEALVLRMGRGITIYKGERGFMKDSYEVSHECDIVFTVITRLEVRKLKNVVHHIDPRAFVFTHTIKETAGGVLKRKIAH